jgi:glycine/D-amino acid oxidase-like deaminating enzyme
LKKELDAAHRAGLHDVKMVDRAPLPSFETGPCLRFPRQAQFHPLKYVSGLLNAIRRDGGLVFLNTRAVEVRGGSPAEVHTRSGHSISAKAVVVATNSPFIDIVSVHTKQHAYRTYAIGVWIEPDVVPAACPRQAGARRWISILTYSTFVLLWKYRTAGRFCTEEKEFEEERGV